ncbi:MAG: DNA replication and repair protein RecF [SAR86 cluster bacterium]|jgi:DNA replication and repair protein RecF|nr:DNA replication and repair protein RecF [SAR86 cluster bacterium]
MSIARLFIKNFRLFKVIDLDLNKKDLLIIGPNGSGKTSILEAINLLVSRKSIRTRDLKECIKEGSEGFSLGLEIKNEDEVLTIKAAKQVNKRVSIKTKLGNITANKSNLPIIQFIQAKDLRMIEGETELRRDFFNKTMFHVEHSSEIDFKNYKKALNQRNISLKRKISERELKAWNEVLVETGSILAEKQKSFFENVFKKSMEEKRKKGDAKEEFLNHIKVVFNRGWPEGLSFSKALMESGEKDRALGYTSVGPHRLDFKYSINNKLAKSFLSRGQQKLLIILSFFRFNDILMAKNTAGVVYLIDDVTSELDQDNLAIVLEQAVELRAQLLITAIKGKSLSNMAPFLDKFRQLIL